MSMDPFERMTHDDFIEALQPENWKEISQRLHTPTFEAVLEDGRLTLQFPSGMTMPAVMVKLKRSDVEALTRFLDQYAGVEPLPASTDPFENFQPTRVEEGEETMQQKQKLDSRVAHRQAGLVAGFMWQDEAAEGHMDGVGVVDYTTVIGTLPEEVNGAPVYLVHVQGTAQSTFGYSYPVERTMKVYLRPGEDEGDSGEPIVADATNEEIVQCEQHGRDLACKEYGELMHIVAVGAYIESSEDGSYWYPDEEGQNISERMNELESAALEQGLHFAAVQVEGKEVYKLEPATPEELDAYAKAKEEAEEEDED